MNVFDCAQVAMTLGITSTTLNLLRTTPNTYQNGNAWTRSEVLQLIGRNGDEEDDNYSDGDYPLPHKKAKVRDSTVQMKRTCTHSLRIVTKD